MQPKIARVRVEEMPRPSRRKRLPTGPVEARSVAPVRKKLTLPRTKPKPEKFE